LTTIQIAKAFIFKLKKKLKKPDFTFALFIKQKSFPTSLSKIYNKNLLNSIFLPFITI